MIASVSGPVRHVGLDRIVIDVGGIGLEVLTTPATAAAQHLDRRADLETSLVVREDSLTLYGFGSPEEKELFEVVQTVSGIGPRLALAMLAVLPPATLRGALSGGDVATLTKVPGIGRKGAERLVLELRDKVATIQTTEGAGGPGPIGAGSPWREQVREALVGLGWNAKAAEGAIDAVAGDVALGDAPSVPALLKAALRELGR